MPDHPFTPAQTEAIGKYAKALLDGDARTSLRAEAETRARAKYDTAVSGVIGLSPEYRRFAVEILVGTDLSKAYQIAFPQYTGGNAGKLGWKLRKNPKIQNAIDEILDNEAMPAKEVIARLSEQARNGAMDYLRPDGSLDLEAIIRDGKQHLIKLVKPGQWGVTVEPHDAHAALTDLGRVHGIFTDKTDVTSGGEKLAAPQIYLPANGRDTQQDGNGD